jgi:N-acetylmuramoyl-L-alanine amidase
MSKLAVVVGHTKADKGSYSDTLKSAEYDWNSDLAKKIAALSTSKIEMKVFLRDVTGSAGIKHAYKAGDQWGADAFVELHFNSADSKTASGTCVLYQTQKSKAWAQDLYDELRAVLNLKPWPSSTNGVCTPRQASGAQERGNGSLTASSAPSALIEPFFGSNPDDSKKAQTNKDKLAAAVQQAAASFFNV